MPHRSDWKWVRQGQTTGEREMGGKMSFPFKFKAAPPHSRSDKAAKRQPGKRGALQPQRFHQILTLFFHHLQGQVSSGDLGPGS